MKTDLHPLPEAYIAPRTCTEFPPRVVWPLAPNKALLISLPFVLVGLVVLGVATKIVPIHQSKVNAPYWVIGLIGLVFAGAGLSMLGGALTSVLRQSRFQKQLAQNAGEPWLADYRWNPECVTNDRSTYARQSVIGLIVVGLILAPFNYVAFVTADDSWFMRIVVAVLDLGFVCGFVATIRAALQAARFGTSILRLRRFPFVLGRTLDATLENAAGLAACRKLTITLRCICETIEEYRDRDNERTIKIVRRCLYEAEEKHVGAAASINAGGSLRISFDLPDDTALSTQLSAHPPQYWELVVRGERPGVNYLARFLVPVYAAPSVRFRAT